MWTVLGAPIDSSGAGRGEEHAPQALRRAGLPGVFGAADAGDVAPPLRDPVRDPATGIIGFSELCACSQALREAVAATLTGGERPLVVGGDCTLLLGTMAGVRDAVGRVGLWFVDGHADYYDGTSSPSGEAADMDLAILTGDGPPGLVDLAGEVPLIEPADVVILGHRPASLSLETAEELGRVPDAMGRVSAEEIAAAGPERVGRRWEQALAARGPVWLHLDVDALDEAALPAVSYPQPRGLDWEAFVALLRPMLASPALVGLSVADFNPDLDVDGGHARRLVDALARALP
ncbi:arginase family protein [Nonomuraea sp. NPDC050536]|uniref:arginase family protein n=1 Tax=Nonomuraea sp. NPDC050536 TaxID=3364366 RepID=UPI0037C7E5B7